DVASVALGPHSDSHAQATPLKQTAATPSSQTAGAEADGPDEALPTSTASPVTSAKLVHDMSQSEFRVGMQTQEFGNIDIRTSVARHMFSAQISVEHSDVAKSMTADLPALYHKLADQQVSVASIVIQGQSFATSSGLAQDSQQPQTWRPQSYNVTRSESEAALPALMEALNSSGRLDIRI
ncbi:MAG: flagellar hook-length control protein FliK, partial [Terriglobales bacterium]